MTARLESNRGTGFESVDLAAGDLLLSTGTSLPAALRHLRSQSLSLRTTSRVPFRQGGQPALLDDEGTSTNSGTADGQLPVRGRRIGARHDERRKPGRLA